MFSGRGSNKTFMYISGHKESLCTGMLVEADTESAVRLQVFPRRTGKSIFVSTQSLICLSVYDSEHPAKWFSPHGDPPASVSKVQKLKECTCMPG